jgi:hypothetical protein
VVLAAAVGVVEGIAEVLAPLWVLFPDVLVVPLLPQLAWQTSDSTVRAGSSSTSCRSISTSLSAPYIKSS